MKNTLFALAATLALATGFFGFMMSAPVSQAATPQGMDIKELAATAPKDLPSFDDRFSGTSASSTWSSTEVRVSLLDGIMAAPGGGHPSLSIRRAHALPRGLLFSRSDPRGARRSDSCRCDEPGELARRVGALAIVVQDVGKRSGQRCSQLGSRGNRTRASELGIGYLDLTFTGDVAGPQKSRSEASGLRAGLLRVLRRITCLGNGACLACQNTPESANQCPT
jgi:hypothetical protein